MSPDPTAQLAALGVEPTYSAREAALLLGRPYSWLDQRVRGTQFTLPDGTVVRPLRTPGGYRQFTLATLRDIATCSYRPPAPAHLREPAFSGAVQDPTGGPRSRRSTALHRATCRRCRR
jgi:hypothetical protein